MLTKDSRLMTRSTSPMYRLEHRRVEAHCQQEADEDHLIDGGASYVGNVSLAPDRGQRRGRSQGQFQPAVTGCHLILGEQARPRGSPRKDE